MMPPLRSAFFFVATIALATAETVPSVPVTISAFTVEGQSQPIDANATGLTVEANGKTLFLPPAADTSLWKESANSGATAKALVLRDGRWSQGLVRLDLAALPQGASLGSAAFTFKTGGAERKGNAVFKCHRMLVDWSENATWFKPFPDQDGTWNGLKPGRDFATEAFANFETAELKKGDKIRMPGFENALQSWSNGSWKNYGFLITLSGKALQSSFPSREASANPRDLLIGGADLAKVVAKFDAVLMQRVLLKPEDFAGGTLRLRVANRKQAPAGVIVRVLSATDGRELASAPVSQASTEGWMEFKGLGDVLQKEAAVAFQASGPLRVYALSDEKSRPQFVMQVREHPKATLFDHEVKPLPGVYNTARDGHFSYGGKRLRLWGMVGYGEADRLRKMGFNAQRVWDPSLSKVFGGKGAPLEAAKRGELPPSAKGDGSPIDKADEHFADLKSHGMFVMFAALTDMIPLKPLLVDDSFIAGGEGWSEWKAAVSAVKDEGDLKRLAIYFDERIQQVRLKSAEALLTHVNPYTGKRYAEEENIAVYEVWNENGSVYRFLNDGKKLPPYFEHEAQSQWSSWLKKKYGNEPGLSKAWGKLNAGETLENVKLAPALAERGAYPEARGRDYAEFLFDTVEHFDKKFRDHCRKLAAQGVGVNVVPFSFDTQYRPSLPWLHVDAQGDVNCPGMYFWGLKSSLATPPSAYVIDNHTVEGVPTVLYETNQSRPNPYRTEYPLKLAALASWQDWDGIFWHYWAGADMTSDEEYLAASMPQLAATHYWTGVQHDKDPVMTSAMAVAGRIFLEREIQPAPNPAIISAGREGVFGWDYANGMGLSKMTFTRGAKIRFVPEAKIPPKAEAPPTETVLSEAIKSGHEILWDWPKGRLIIDTPSVKAYVGRVSHEPYVFRDGTVLGGISTPWICWTLASADGQPLAETQHAFVTGVYDAKNTDFDFDWNVAGGPVDQAKAIRNRGRAPVQVDKVGYTLSLPAQADFKFHGYDFATREVLAGTQQNSSVLRVKPAELWMGELDFTRRGGKASPVLEANTGALPDKSAEATSATFENPGEARLNSVWNPIPGLKWSDPYTAVEKKLRDSKIPFGSLQMDQRSNAGNHGIHWTEAVILFESPANIDITYEGGHMSRIAATFTRPPDLKAVAAAYEAQFGHAQEKVFKSQEEQSILHWSVKLPVGSLDIRATEAQGTQVIVYELKKS